MLLDPCVSRSRSRSTHHDFFANLAAASRLFVVAILATALRLFQNFTSNCEKIVMLWPKLRKNRDVVWLKLRKNRDAVAKIAKKS